MHSQGSYANSTTDARAIHDAAGNPAPWSTGSVTGVDAIDMWVGGLAEKISLFGGQLGSTFEFVFRTQLEALQDGDRLYYVPRIEGMDYEESLQDSSLAQLIRINTGIAHLPGNMFLTPEYTIESSDYFVKDATQADGFAKDANGNKIATDPSTWLHNPIEGNLLVNVLADGTVQFLGDDNFLGNTIVLGGTAGDDKLTAGFADDDTVWGDAGDDTIDGGGGNDFLFGGTGNDTVIGGQGDDTIHGDEGNDTIFGGDGADIIFGGDGNDYIQDGRGDDAVFGGLGNDIIIANEGSDEMQGGEGDDWLESRGGQGQLMFGDSGAPTGQVPLYSGNDVMIGGVAGGDVMKGFSGDDIMLGQGSFTKFNGGLGFDWASYELAIHGVDADLNRKELVAANGSEDSIRDIYQAVEGLSGSDHDDILTGSNATKLVVARNELSNLSLITGLAGFFTPGAALPADTVPFDGGDIILGGAGNDVMIGGAGDDIMDGDAYLHVALTSYSAGGQIIRSINYDPNGNTFDPVTGGGNFNPINVDTAVFNDVRANYNVALFGADAEGFITVQHIAGAPGAVGKVDDGTDRLRHIERLQFADVTVSIDANGNELSSSAAAVPSPATFGYDTVPVGTPTISESGGLDPAVTVTAGNKLTANVDLFTDVNGVVHRAIADADGVGTLSFQWQVLNIISGKWIDIVGANAKDFTPGTFQDGESLRVEVSYTDGLGFKETVVSAATALVTLPGNINTAPIVVAQAQYNGIPNTTALVGQPFDFTAPFSTIFSDAQTAATALIYTATTADGQPLASVGLSFTFNPVTGVGEFQTVGAGLATPGQLAIRVTATDTGPGVPLSVTNTFVINVLPADTPPVANPDAYSILENATLAINLAKLGPAATVTPLNTVGVLANDTDADFGDRLTAQLVSGPAHGVLVFNKDGTFRYTPTKDFAGNDTFTYVANDSFLKSSNVATVSIQVVAVDVPVSEHLSNDTGVSSHDLVTFDPTLAGGGNPNAVVSFTVDGVPLIQTVTADATGAWTFTPVLADGTYTVVASETKLGGVGLKHRIADVHAGQDESAGDGRSGGRHRGIRDRQHHLKPSAVWHGRPERSSAGHGRWRTRGVANDRCGRQVDVHPGCSGRWRAHGFSNGKRSGRQYRDEHAHLHARYSRAGRDRGTGVRHRHLRHRPHHVGCNTEGHCGCEQHGLRQHRWRCRGGGGHQCSGGLYADADDCRRAAHRDGYGHRSGRQRWQGKRGVHARYRGAHCSGRGRLHLRHQRSQHCADQLHAVRHGGGGQFSRADQPCGCRPGSRSLLRRLMVAGRS